jgi:molecular chaperone DnaJ
LSVTQAAMGTEIRVPTLEGEHALKIPDGTQPGTTFRVRNKGVPVLNGHGKGDLYFEVRVQIPSKLSKRQKELLQELETTTKVDNQPMMRSLLGKVKDMFG